MFIQRYIRAGCLFLSVKGGSGATAEELAEHLALEHGLLGDAATLLAERILLFLQGRPGYTWVEGRICASEDLRRRALGLTNTRLSDDAYRVMSEIALHFNHGVAMVDLRERTGLDSKQLSRFVGLLVENRCAYSLQVSVRSELRQIYKSTSLIVVWAAPFVGGRDDFQLQNDFFAHIRATHNIEVMEDTFAEKLSSSRFLFQQIRKQGGVISLQVALERYISLQQESKIPARRIRESVGSVLQQLEKAHILLGFVKDTAGEYVSGSLRISGSKPISYAHSLSDLSDDPRINRGQVVRPLEYAVTALPMSELIGKTSGSNLQCYHFSFLDLQTKGLCHYSLLALENAILAARELPQEFPMPLDSVFELSMPTLSRDTLGTHGFVLLELLFLNVCTQGTTGASFSQIKRSFGLSAKVLQWYLESIRDLYPVLKMVAGGTQQLWFLPYAPETVRLSHLQDKKYAATIPDRLLRGLSVLERYSLWFDLEVSISSSSELSTTFEFSHLQSRSQSRPQRPISLTSTSLSAIESLDSQTSPKVTSTKRLDSIITRYLRRSAPPSIRELHSPLGTYETCVLCQRHAEAHIADDVYHQSLSLVILQFFDLSPAYLRRDLMTLVLDLPPSVTSSGKNTEAGASHRTVRTIIEELVATGFLLSITLSIAGNPFEVDFRPDITVSTLEGGPVLKLQDCPDLEARLSTFITQSMDAVGSNVIIPSQDLTSESSTYSLLQTLLLRESHLKSNDSVMRSNLMALEMRLQQLQDVGLARKCALLHVSLSKYLFARASNFGYDPGALETIPFGRDDILLNLSPVLYAVIFGIPDSVPHQQLLRRFLYQCPLTPIGDLEDVAIYALCGLKSFTFRSNKLLDWLTHLGLVVWRAPATSVEEDLARRFLDSTSNSFYLNLRVSRLPSVHLNATCLQKIYPSLSLDTIAKRLYSFVSLYRRTFDVHTSESGDVGVTFHTPIILSDMMAVHNFWTLLEDFSIRGSITLTCNATIKDVSSLLQTGKGPWNQLLTLGAWKQAPDFRDLYSHICEHPVDPTDQVDVLDQKGIKALRPLVSLFSQAAINTLLDRMAIIILEEYVKVIQDSMARDLSSHTFYPLGDVRISNYPALLQKVCTSETITAMSLEDLTPNGLCQELLRMSDTIFSAMIYGAMFITLSLESTCEDTEECLTSGTHPISDSGSFIFLTYTCCFRASRFYGRVARFLQGDETTRPRTLVGISPFLQVSSTESPLLERRVRRFRGRYKTMRRLKRDEEVRVGAGETDSIVTDASSIDTSSELEGIVERFRRSYKYREDVKMDQSRLLGLYGYLFWRPLPAFNMVTTTTTALTDLIATQPLVMRYARPYPLAALSLFFPEVDAFLSLPTPTLRNKYMRRYSSEMKRLTSIQAQGRTGAMSHLIAQGVFQSLSEYLQGAYPLALHSRETGPLIETIFCKKEPIRDAISEYGRLNYNTLHCLAGAQVQDVVNDSILDETKEFIISRGLAIAPISLWEQYVRVTHLVSKNRDHRNFDLDDELFFSSITPAQFFEYAIYITYHWRNRPRLRCSTEDGEISISRGLPNLTPQYHDLLYLQGMDESEGMVSSILAITRLEPFLNDIYVYLQQNLPDSRVELKAVYDELHTALLRIHAPMAMEIRRVQQRSLISSQEYSLLSQFSVPNVTFDLSSTNSELMREIKVYPVCDAFFFHLDRELLPSIRYLLATGYLSSRSLRLHLKPRETLCEQTFNHLDRARRARYHELENIPLPYLYSELVSEILGRSQLNVFTRISHDLTVVRDAPPSMVEVEQLLAKAVVNTANEEVEVEEEVKLTLGDVIDPHKYREFLEAYQRDPYALTPLVTHREALERSGLFTLQYHASTYTYVPLGADLVDDEFKLVATHVLNSLELNKCLRQIIYGVSDHPGMTFAQLCTRFNTIIPATLGRLVNILLLDDSLVARHYHHPLGVYTPITNVLDGSPDLITLSCARDLAGLYED
ncbi:hypothetical protein GMRT_11400 [Giardia muris]|uniref:B-block binding subunit of TFIIIC domain-containing protein n=1 Tax=Giardia muris TaxID=5742 RepID=A0A4Z1SSV1_GIAMU|nr:hypothetical protein GMRT_11400 [Giardia muris]|eukprot:TNJ28954.1 hypothetical protein GMRT_11400 [Giardia muris]